MKISIASFFLVSIAGTNGFSQTSPSELAELARGRLREALRSPAGKLTLSPEIIIPEPNDPTALLLQASEVTKTSAKLRTQGKINAAFLSGSLSTVNQFVSEQENARGSFPGPVPVIYCGFSSTGDDSDEMLSELAEFGCAGIISSVCSGRPISSADDLKEDEEWMKKALSAGVQPIPEVVLNMEKAWEVEDISKIIEVLKEKCGSDDGPASLVLTLDVTQNANDADETEGEDSEEASDDDDKVDMEKVWQNVPKFAKSFSKQTSILGSVRVGGMEELTDYTAQLKAKGFTGAFLRADCVPGFRMNPDLDFVAGFWSAVVSNLKSVKSKNFEFRSKMKLEKDVPLEWMNYQKDVMESGALGSTSAKANVDELDSARGDYKGF